MPAPASRQQQEHCATSSLSWTTPFEKDWARWNGQNDGIVCREPCRAMVPFAAEGNAASCGEFQIELHGRSSRLPRTVEMLVPPTGGHRSPGVRQDQVELPW